MATPTFSQLQGSPGSALAVLVSGTNPDGTTYELPVAIGTLAPANILDGFQSVTATTGATTLITVPAGRAWSGTISINVGVTVTAASTVTGNMQCVVSVSGAGAIPTAGSYFQCNAVAGANAATGLTGSEAADSLGPIPFTVVAPAGNAVLVQSTVTLAGTTGVSNVSVIGALQ